MLFVSSTIQSQDTIYLSKTGKIVLDKTKASRYRIVIKTDAVNDTFVEYNYDLDWNLRNERLCYNYYKKKKEILKYESFYKSGDKHIIRVYLKGKVNGDFLSYWPNGALKRKDFYKKGKFIEGKCWDENGNEVAYYDYKIHPKFPGGKGALTNYVRDNFDLNQVPNVSSYRKVQVSFYIDKDGSVVDAKMRKTADPMTNYQALKLVMDMPKWSPGLMDGSPVRVKYTLPITLRDSPNQKNE